MSTETKMIIEIQPESVQLTQIRDGVRSTKQTNLRAIQEVLTQDKSLQTPILPSLWGVQYYARNNDRELYVITTPAHNRKVTFDGDGSISKFEVPMPPMCWFIIAKNRPGSEERIYQHGMVYAIKQQVLSGRDRLFRYPFANVDNRWMCWGSGTGPAIGAAKGVQMIPDHFLGMHFNHHLDENKFEQFKAKVSGQEIRLFRTSHLFKYMDQELKKDEKFQFPYNSLIPEGTLQEAIDRHAHEFLR